MSAPRRVHYLGTTYASRAACGRLSLLGNPWEPLHSAVVEQVTCRACLAAVARTDK